VLSKDEIKNYRKLAFTSDNLAYDVDFSLSDCKLQKNKFDNELCYIVKCNSKHKLTISDKILSANDLLSLNKRSILVKCFRCSDSIQKYYVYIDDVIRDIIFVDKCLNIKYSIRREKNIIKLFLQSNKNVKCELQYNKQCFNSSIDYSQLELSVNKKYMLEFVDKCNTMFEAKLKCNNETYYITENIQYKETLNDKVINFIKENGIIILIAIVLYLLYREYQKHKAKFVVAKEQLEKEE
jgi:hypothetical protein